MPDRKLDLALADRSPNGSRRKRWPIRTIADASTQLSSAALEPVCRSGIDADLKAA
jgi:hypothetical protein